MRQVLFWVPLSKLHEGWPDLPLYGYGAMLFVAFLATTWLAGKLAQREGIDKGHVQDLAIWLFVTGIVGARLTYILQYWNNFHSFGQFFAIWDGGLVFYGSFIGGAIGYLLVYRFILRKHGISQWKLLDVIAPCVALGLCIGRLGCLLNGCCYGNVACPDCAAISFPLSAAPRQTFTERGLQTAAGFTTQDEINTYVGAVESASPAFEAGLKPGDRIVAVNGKTLLPDQLVGEEAAFRLQDPSLNPFRLLNFRLNGDWPRGKNDLQLTVVRNGEEIVLPVFAPYSLGLHPTQIYETISMGLLTLVLLAYYPLKRFDGSVMVWFMFAYAGHRFLNEMLRTDTAKVAFNMTLSQNISILLAITGCILAGLVYRRPPREESFRGSPPLPV